MSHFSVLVTDDDVEKALAPYDENLEVPRFMAKSKADLVADVRQEIENYRTGLYARYLADPIVYAANTSNVEHLRYLAEGFPKKLAWTDDECYADAIEWIDKEDLDDDGNYWTTNNPQGYWDYWRIGGRWAGGLYLKDGAPGHVEPLSWEWKYEKETPDFTGRADRARKGDVDLDATPATYAIVHDGQWIALGTMGWFGVSHSETVTEEEWSAKWREIVEALPDDTPLTVVDCHV